MGFREWLKKKQQISTDRKFKMLVNFVLIVDEYHEFRMVLEYLYHNFLPKFYLTKKKHYDEIILTQIDTFYSMIGHQKLQLV